jgi:PTH1 family peptidyl-tRNA hydrolase
MVGSEGGPALLVGLGNPGREYRDNRHNVGFMSLEEIARRAGADLRVRRFQGVCGQGQLGGRKVVLLRPETYMNLSGESVGPAARFFRVPPEDVLVLHDDVDLPFGRLQVKDGGGHGGHNGLKSIVAHLGTNAFRRIRIGVGRPPDSRIPVADYVLSDFYPEERRALEGVLWLVAEAAEMVLREGVRAAMNRFNGRARESQLAKAKE